MPAPIDIASRPQAGQPKSNLTSQLHAARDMPMMMNESYGARSGSISQYAGGIPMSSSRIRRESMMNGDLARSLLNNGGLSWGAGVSVGSWIRDDIMMSGTSPFTFQSPSFHSSSYLPKLEAEFCRDFSCCGIPLPSLHDLLLHYEEHHAQQMPMNNDNENQDNHQNGRGGAHDVNRQQSRHSQQQNAGITSPIGGIGGIQYEMMRQQQMQRQRQQQQEEERGNNHQDDQPEGEIAGDMEMDDEMTPPPNMAAPLTSQQAHLGQQHFSHPTTPSNMNLPSYHSTPNLATAQLPHLAKPPSHFSPESSVPGTPLATDNLEFGFPQNLGGFPGQQFNTNLQYGSGIETSGDLSLNLCIDEPAKRLFSPGGQTLNVYGQAQMQQYMSNGSSDLSKKLGESGSGQVPTMQAALMQVEDKPFKCPVIGCEKAYKNQNGLKYHKAHGHTNQQLHDNADGTFSIVNPETSAPYPGTLGMEKEKPYRCEYCGKRYKNLNGLKYHRTHSTHPNVPGTMGSAPGTPQQQHQQPMQQQQPVPGGVVAVAGGMDDVNRMGLP